MGGISSCNARTDRANGSSPSTTAATAIRLGDFQADSAYNHIVRQVSFGPRVPGTAAHDACRDYIVAKLKEYNCDSVFVQHGTVTAFNGDELPIDNIIAGYNIDATRRILLVAHYDTRPWADKAADPDERNKPIPGANDGGSGVGVILEIARNLARTMPAVGVDMLFTDAEDYGDESGLADKTETWCLGTQYWVEQGMPPYRAEILPIYGILLDMVGGRDARFYYEHFSEVNAPQTVIKVWSEGESLGYGDRFIRSIGGSVTDDHVFITNAGIPTIDIIELNNVETNTFPPTWHSHHDNIDNIERSALKAVGETVLNVIYKEKAN